MTTHKNSFFDVCMERTFRKTNVSMQTLQKAQYGYNYNYAPLFQKRAKVSFTYPSHVPVIALSLHKQL